MKDTTGKGSSHKGKFGSPVNIPCEKGQGNGRMYSVYVLRVMLEYRGVKIILIGVFSL